MSSEYPCIARTAVSFGIIALTVLASCSHSPRRSSEIVAVVPFEDLTPDAGGLLGREAAYVATAASEGDTKTRVIPAATLGEARNGSATQVITGWYAIQNGIARLHGTLRDLPTQKILRTFETSGSPADYARLGAAIARETGATVHQWTAPAPEAFEAYIRALSATNPDQEVQLLQQSVNTDPSFGSAQLALIQSYTRNNQRQSAEAQLARAASARFNHGEREKFEFVRAQLAGDGKAAMAALKKIATSGLADVTSLKRLLQAEIAQQDFRSAAQTASQILELAPTDEEALNQRAYLWAYAGDLAQARKALDDYAAKYPKGPNTYDSTGEVLFYFRRYQEASGQFEKAYQLNRGLTAEPFRSALSLHLAGKPDQAETTLKPLLDQADAAKAPDAAIARGMWAYITGGSAQWPSTASGLAMNSLATLAAGNRDVAAALAQKARTVAQNPNEANLSGIAGFVSQPSASAHDWQQRVAGIVKDPKQETTRAELLGWALFLDSHFAEAAAVWQSALSHVPALTPAYNDLRMATACAWAKSGNAAEARKIMPYGWMPPSSLQPGITAILHRTMPQLALGKQ